MGKMLNKSILINGLLLVILAMLIFSGIIIANSTPIVQFDRFDKCVKVISNDDTLTCDNLPKRYDKERVY